MSTTSVRKKFGTAPVFFTAISTILGAIMFLRFGFAVGQVGFAGTLLIILIGHAVTIPTAMAIAEIATNQRVEGGGEYFIISRSFGLVIGSAIGIALYFSQAISVAFYIMAFSESFTPLFTWMIERFNLPGWAVWILEQKQTVGIPALLGLTYIMLTKGADLGVKTLYVVVATLGISLVAFFVGKTDYSQTTTFDPFATVKDVAIHELQPGDDVAQHLMPTEDLVNNNPDSVRQSPSNTGNMQDLGYLLPVGFFTVFSIIFPAFTGMTAGVGLSGDLKDPGKSIPMGTLAATISGMVIYIFIAYKLAVSAPPEQLADTSRLVMADIAWQGWLIIPLGLAAATISSALGSIMVAPRTLQAIARDHIFPIPKANKWLAKGKGKNDEPYNASIFTILLAGAFILAGALDSVAQVISMFFMVTYGSLCLISFLNHFAADPSYRPRFRSRWYLSLFGAVACFGLMFLMNSAYAILAIIMMVVLYYVISVYNPDKRSIAVIFQGVIFQVSRQIQVFLQKAEKEKSKSWRPSAVAMSESTFERLCLFDLLRWIAHKYGFGTYIHLHKGFLSSQAHQEAEETKQRLIKMAEVSHSNIYVDTMVSPSYTSSIASVIQLPGIAGTENNLVLFDYASYKPDNLPDIIDNYNLIRSVNFDVVILACNEKGFGLKKEIHIWLTSSDFENANLMILLSYIILGHRDWNEGEIKIFALYPESTVAEEKARLFGLIKAGQLPISAHNIKVLERKEDEDKRQIIRRYSEDADMVVVGFRGEALKKKGAELFTSYKLPCNTVFVNAAKPKDIK
ncbi:MAG: amino acid permease [Saprospirales bacterium]|nr:amino acid permease [Saprospirales bacterium]